MTDSRPIPVHKRNPAWEGPLCRYEIAEGLRIRRQPPVLTDDDSLVTCVNCRRRLGFLPKLTMPGQDWLMAKKRAIIGALMRGDEE